MDFNTKLLDFLNSFTYNQETIDEIINLLYNESLFDVEQFREHYLKFLQKTIL